MKQLLFFCLLLINSSAIEACDICGCGVGNNYIGILPDFSSKIFGVRYRYNSLLTHVGVNGMRTYLTTHETYQTAEFWGGWNLTKKIRLMASVPYAFNQKENSSGESSKNGLGDITLVGYYQLINNRHTLKSDKLLIQSLWVGAGVKAPTGKYNPLDKTAANENPNLFQFGTASTDFLLSGMYDIRLQDAGVNVAANYKINTNNRYDYQYGNKGSVAGQLYYKLKLGKAFTVSPNAGLQFEKAAGDIDNHFEVDVSGGNLLLATTGLEAVCKSVAIGGNWQTPLSQNLGKGFVQANNKFMLHLSLVL